MADSLTVHKATKGLREAPLIPGDKSISHRALMLSAMADGESVIKGLSNGDDVVRTTRAIEQLGAVVKRQGPIDSPVALLAQTTLAHSEWENILETAQEKFPDVWMPGKSDLCFATTNRQSAVRELAPKVDAFVVLGSENSSNTRALERTAREFGAQNVMRINSANELPDDIEGIVAVTAGASAPEELVQEIVRALAPLQPVEEYQATDEDEYFPVPRELRELADENDEALQREYSATQALRALSY